MSYKPVLNDHVGYLFNGLSAVEHIGYRNGQDTLSIAFVVASCGGWGYSEKSVLTFVPALDQIGEVTLGLLVHIALRLCPRP